MMMKIGLAVLVLVYLCQTSWNRQLGASRHSLLCVRVHICVCVCMNPSNPESIQTKAVLFQSSNTEAKRLSMCSQTSFYCRVILDVELLLQGMPANAILKENKQTKKRSSNCMDVKWQIVFFSLVCKHTYIPCLYLN